MPPAQWLVDCVIAASLRSCSVTLRPELANSNACHAPAMPAPITEIGDCPRGLGELGYTPVRSPAWPGSGSKGDRGLLVREDMILRISPGQGGCGLSAPRRS